MVKARDLETEGFALEDLLKELSKGSEDPSPENEPPGLTSWEIANALGLTLGWARTVIREAVRQGRIKVYRTWRVSPITGIRNRSYIYYVPQVDGDGET